MKRRSRVRLALAPALALSVLVPAAVTVAVPVAGAAPSERPAAANRAASGAAPAVRVATYNVSLNRATEGELVADLRAGDQQAADVAEVLQRVRPDVVLLNEFDFDADGEAVDLFRERYLEVGQGGARAIRYPHAFTAPVNTGVPSGSDLNGDGRVGGPDDALGFGFFPGQYGMVVLSRFPIVQRDVRTFQDLLWRDLPGALLPDDASTPAPADFYSPEELALLPLSSKSHWDVPVRVRGEVVHVLASHPTPPIFDAAEDRNGRRNHDEVRFWAEYVAGGPAASWVVDDEGGRGGLMAGASFVVLGDLNSDPADGDSVAGTAQQLLDHPLVQDPEPRSDGGAEAAALQGGANASHRGDPALDTADFADGAPGNLRVDYVLPSVGLGVVGAGVFWPVQADPLTRLTGTFPFPTSDHRPVWVDLRVG